MTSVSSAGTLVLVAWINRALEFLWLAAVVLVPLAFIDRNHAVSEAVIAYVEVPKIALLRTVAGLMAMLWLLEWAIRGRLSLGSLFAWSPSKIRASSPWSGLGTWLRGHPARWLLLAVWLFLGSTLLTTVLSGSFQTSLWGEIPGQDGYAAYTVASYVLLFAVIATHLKTRSQVGRLVTALVAVGVLVGGYAVLQHYGYDFLDLTEETGGGQGRATSFMGNAIFSAAVMSMTIPITLMASVVTFTEPAARSGRLGRKLKQWLLASGITGGWGLVLAVQLLGIAFTLSRGPWLGTALSLAAFLGLALLFVGWRAFGRGALVLGLAAVFALAFLQWQGSVSMLGTGPWSGALMALVGLTGVGVAQANWRLFGRLALFLGVGLIVLAAGVLGPSGLKDIGGFLGDQPRPSDSSVGDAAGELGARFSSISTEVLSSFSGGRGTHWRVSWLLIRERPWFDFDQLHLRWLRPLVGYGPDLFRYTYLLKSPAEGPGINPLEPDNAHNYFIHQTVDQGLLGLMSSLGIFAAVFLAGAYLLLGQRIRNSALHNLLIIGLLATLAGRFLEMMVGVARVSDLTVLWVVLALLASLMRNPHAGEKVEQGPAPHRRDSRARSRPHPGSSFANRPMDLRLFWRLALVAWLVGGIGMLTWTKSISYVRAAVAEGQAVRHFQSGDFQASLTSLDRAIDLAPDVPVYHTNRALLFLAYLANKEMTPEYGCSLPEAPSYDVCLATKIYGANLDGVSQRPLYYRSRLALAHSAGLFPLAETAQRYTESLSLLPNSWLIRNQLAETYIKAGQPEAALQPLLASLRITEGSSQSAEALYLLGVAYRDAGRPEEVVQSLEHSLDLGLSGHRAVQAHQILARFYIDSGQLDRAIKSLDQAIGLDSQNPQSFAIRGDALSKAGQHQQGVTDYKEALRLDSRTQLDSGRFGMSHLELGHIEQAIQALDLAIRQDPMDGELFAYRGTAYSRLGQHQRAFQDLDEAVKLSPHDVESFYLRGLASFALDRYEATVKDLNEAINLSPGFLEALNLRSRALFALGRDGQAAQDRASADRLKEGPLPAASYYNDRGLAYLSNGEYERAIRDFDLALTLAPGSFDYYFSRGRAYSGLGDHQRSIEDYDQAIHFSKGHHYRRSSSFFLFFFNRALARFNLGDYQEAIEDINEAIKRFDHPDVAEALILRSRSHLALGRDGQAAQDRASADRLKEGPVHPASYYNDSGLAYLSNGEYERAIRDFDLALILAPGSFNYYFNRGWAYSGLGNHQRSIEDYNQAIRFSKGHQYLRSPSFFLFFFNRALARFNLGDYQEAIQDIDEAIERFDHPDVAEAHVLRGISYGQLGRAEMAAEVLQEYVAAIDDLDLGYRHNPQVAMVFYTRGLAHFYLGNYLQAITYFDEAIGLDPGDAAAYKDRGKTYLQLGRNEQAIQDLDRAIGANVKDPEAYLVRAQVRFNLEQYRRAIDDLDQALGLDPFYSPAYRLRGDSYRGLGKVHQARVDYARAARTGALLVDAQKLKKVIHQGPDNAIDYTTRGLAYSSIGEYQRAIRDFDLALTLAPGSFDYYFNRGRAYSGLGDHQRSIEDYDQAIDLSRKYHYLRSPSFFLFFFNRALARFNLGDYQEAIEDIDKAIERSDYPDVAEALILRGISYGQLGRAQMAAEVLEEYVTDIDDLDLGYRHNPQVAMVFYTRGLAHFYLGNYLKAISYFDEAIGLDPGDAAAYKDRGKTYLQLGRIEQAIQDLDRAIGANVKDPEAYLIRAQVHSNLEQYRRAIDDLDQALGLDPFYSPAYRLRGDSYRGLGEVHQARADYARAARTGALLVDAQKLKKVIHQGPNNAIDYNTRGLAYSSIGEYQRAIRDFDLALILAPGSFDYYFNRGWAYSGLGDHQRSIEDYNQAIHFSKRYHYLRSPSFFLFFFNRALARFNLGDYQEAIEDIDKAIERFDHPDAAEALILRGISYGQLGRPETVAEVLQEYVAAIDDLDLGYRHNPQVAMVFYTRGLAHFYLGNYLKAISYFDEAIELNPQLAEAFAMRGRALLALGRDGEAAQDLERAERLNSG